MTWIVFAYHIASRLAYVLGVGFTLRRQDRTGFVTERHGVEGGFQRFRRTAALLMGNDAVSFVVLCLVSANTLRIALPYALTVGVGVVFVVVGILTKLWAAATLGDGYYWRNFFAPADPVPNSGGPYRWLKNPMYTVGYLPTYGLALVTGSVLGLVAALFDQTAILLFYRLVEKPHFELITSVPDSARPPSHGTAPGRQL